MSQVFSNQGPPSHAVNILGLFYLNNPSAPATTWKYIHVFGYLRANVLTYKDSQDNKARGST